jgi:beta-glucosidase
MIDISRDPRWGRVAESLGEDPFLCSSLANAMVKGFQGDNLSDGNAIAACAKHFAGYGASEGGKDYNTTNIPENELRNVYFPPFKAVADSGVATFMASFSDLNGVPATGNSWLLTDVLRNEWNYTGAVVSDWDAIPQLITHGFSSTQYEAASQACSAGIDMEMASDCYLKQLKDIVSSNDMSIKSIDNSVKRILMLKYELGLFESAITLPTNSTKTLNPLHLSIAKEAAIKSSVLLKNDNQILPISTSEINNIAVIGPLADDGYEQMGTWAFDGKAHQSQTLLKALEKRSKNTFKVSHAVGMETTRCNHDDGFSEAVTMAENSDVALMVLGEEAILSGEAHCRANIDLPGAQEQLIEAIYKTGTPIILVIMAGRPITLEKILPKVDALLFAWHPGTMAGPAIIDLLFGEESPSGKLPITFPRSVGQIPLYYAQKNSGRPPSEDKFIDLNTIKMKAPQTSFGMAATYLDTHFSPLFPFGFGLSYSKFCYSDISLNKAIISMGSFVEVSATISNIGHYDAEEVVQLYIRDIVGSVTRPIKELKGYQRLFLARKTSTVVKFKLHTDEFSFYNQKMEFTSEPGKFHVWIGGDSNASLQTDFIISNE